MTKVYALTTDDCDSASRVLLLSRDPRKIADRALELLGNVQTDDPEDVLVERTVRWTKAALARFIEQDRPAPDVRYLPTAEVDLYLWIETLELD